MVLYCTPLAKNTSKLRVLVGFQKIRPVFRSAPGAPWEIHVHGRSSRELFGEIGLSEFRIVFAEVFICPETMRLLQESSREPHFEATVTRFEFPGRSGRKSEMQQVGITGSRIVFFEFAATRFDLADRFYPAPGRGRFILKGARLRRASGLAGQGSLLFRPGTQNFSFLFSGIFELRAASIYNRSQLGFFVGGFEAEPGAP